MARQARKSTNLEENIKEINQWFHISSQEQVNCDEMMMMPALYQVYLQCQLTENNSSRVHIYRSTRKHYSDSEQTSPYSYSLVLHAQWSSNKFQFHSLWYDLTGGRTQIYHTRGEHGNRYTTDADDFALQLNTKFSDNIRPTIIQGLYPYEYRNIASF